MMMTTQYKPGKYQARTYALLAALRYWVLLGIAPSDFDTYGRWLDLKSREWIFKGANK